MFSRPTFVLFLFIFTCSALLPINKAFPQSTDKIKLKSTEGGMNASARRKAYYYPKFEEGNVLFVSGVNSKSLLNYNMLSGEIEFINSKKDTFALDNLHTVKMITIGTDAYYYNPDDKLLLKLVDDVDGTKLLVKEKYELSNIKNVGAMGMESSTTAPNSSINTDYRATQNGLKSNESLIFSVKTAYYFAVQNSFLPATKANFLKLFPGHSEALKKYMKDNKTNFKEEEEIKKLFKYASSL